MLSKESKEALMYECMTTAARSVAEGGNEAEATRRVLAIVKATLAADEACGFHGVPSSVADRSVASFAIKNSA